MKSLAGFGGPEPAAACGGNRQAERRESQGAPSGATMRVPRISAPIVPHPRSAIIKNRSGAEGDYCDSVNASSGSLTPICVQILTMQIKPVSIVGCYAACSETTFSRIDGIRWAAAQTCLRDVVPQTPFFASRALKQLRIT